MGEGGSHMASNRPVDCPDLVRTVDDEGLCAAEKPYIITEVVEGEEGGWGGWGGVTCWSCLVPKHTEAGEERG